MSEPFKLGNYAINAIIGRGSMGIVYKAFDPTIQQDVAIKTINRELLEGKDRDPANNQPADRFRMEVLAGRKLKHANIVRIYEYGVQDDQYYIVMEYVQGRTLQDYFAEGHRFDLDTVQNIMLQILDALGYAHRQGVIHRDIKPANIMLTQDHGVQIADFGVAKVFDGASSTLTGYAVGTPSYMAPEQWHVDEPPDARADIFSAGILLYQFLTGRHPFRGPTTADTIEQIRTRMPVDVSQVEIGLPKAYDGVVRKALQKDPHARYQSAEDFAHALRMVTAQLREYPVSPVAADPKEKEHVPWWQSIGVALLSVVMGLGLAWLAVLHWQKSGLPVQERQSAEANIARQRERALTALLTKFECAHVEVDALASGVPKLRGFVRPQDMEPFHQGLRADPLLQTLPLQAQALEWPYCEVFKLLSPFKRGNKWEFAEAQNTRQYVEGDPLAMTLKSPNYEAYVYIDYFQKDGSVVHMYPLRAEDNKRLAANASIEVGDTADGAHEWRIQPPFGMEMIVVMAASDPLFGIMRPEYEHGRDYLDAVRAAIAEGHKHRLTADYYFINSKPRS